tara:strand:+ start:2272 stop:3819 length:1548 start_codon:yes stop_codon:yes gene_type:complete
MKKLKLFVGYFLILFSLSSSILFLKDYNQNKFIYLIFSLIVNYFFIKNFFTNFFISEFLLSFYLWFGFWFSLTIRNVLFWNRSFSFENTSNDVVFSRSEGITNYKEFQSVLDESLVLSIFAFFSILLSFYSIKFIFKKFINLKFSYNFQPNEYYNKYRNIIIILLILCVLTIASNNYLLSIYQKGLISEFNLFIISAFLKWSYLIGFPFAFGIILFLEIKSTNPRLYLTTILILILSFTLYVSLLSRAMIFEVISILIGIFLISNNKLILNRIFIFTAFCGLILSVFSILITEDLRKNLYLKQSFQNKTNNLDLNYNIYNHTTKNKILFKNISFNQGNKSLINVQYKKKTDMDSRVRQFVYVVLNRWVGLEAIVLMTKNKHLLNYDLLKDSFKEKKINDFSFYEKKFIKETSTRNLVEGTFGIILPGIIAFLYYPGSYIFLFLSIFIIIFFLVSLEKIIIKISNGNLILVSIATNIIVYRLIHFGYVPKDSYLLFGSLFLTLCIYFIFVKFLSKK